MRSKLLYNSSTHTLVVSILVDINEQPLVIRPGEVKRVTESTFKHIALRKYLGTVLLSEIPKPQRTTKTTETPGIPKVVASENTEVTRTLRDEYLTAPGVTEKNVDALVLQFPTKEKLAMAFKRELLDCGVAKSYFSRLKEWASKEKENESLECLSL